MNVCILVFALISYDTKKAEAPSDIAILEADIVLSSNALYSVSSKKYGVYKDCFFSAEGSPKYYPDITLEECEAKCDWSKSCETFSYAIYTDK